MKILNLFVGIACLSLLSCQKKGSLSEQKEIHPLKDRWSANLVELSDEQYPDNPDIGRSHSKVSEVKLDSVYFTLSKDSLFELSMLTESGLDTIMFSAMSLMEFIPTIQNRFKKNEYLSHISVVNQEWNRNQVKFDSSYFKVKGGALENITRIDIARNCLNTYLWEVIAYAQEDGKNKAYYHGWFDFPKELFASLFYQRNGVEFSKYASSMEHWIHPENNKIPLNELREVISSDEVTFSNHNSEEYLKVGERDKKYQNIIYPKNTTKIQDFLTDSTLFATFTPPGFYNTKDPRKTKLSRLASPDKIHVRKVKEDGISEKELLEIEVIFNVEDSVKHTHLILSGLDVEEIPILDSSEVNKGWQSSMGFANHTFYETYEHAQTCKVENNPYFAYLTDHNHNWLDSHDIGIDGPLLYKEKNNPKKLHVLLLSFERHAIVGHYSFVIPF